MFKNIICMAIVHVTCAFNLPLNCDITNCIVPECKDNHTLIKAAWTCCPICIQFIMVDESGNIPNESSYGNVMEFGSYERCLKTRDNKTEESFRGRFCMIGYTHPMTQPFETDHPKAEKHINNYVNLTVGLVKRGSDNISSYTKLWFGTCVPSTCATADLNNFLSKVPSEVGAQVSVAECQIDEINKNTLHTIISICILGVIATACTFGTVVDFIIRLKNIPSYITNHVCCKIIKAFSFLTHIETLFINIPDGGPLGCFYGIRFFSTTWIVLCHTYYLGNTVVFIENPSFWEVHKNFNKYWSFAVIENYFLPVGTFFFISGYLVAYSTWKKLEKGNGKLNLVTFIVHKYCRLTPSIILVIIVLLSMPAMNSGPLWKSTLDPYVQNCQKNWWKNILYINNFDLNQCAPHTWYLAALMQLHILGAVWLMLLFRWPIFGTFLGIAIILGTSIASFVVTVFYRFPLPAGTFIKEDKVYSEYDMKIYYRAYHHISSYFIGMLTSLFILKYKDKKLPQWVQGIAWVLAICFSLYALYGLYGSADSVYISAFYVGFHGIGWAVGVAWLVYVCITGKAGILNSFLSWKPFIPLGHLCFLVYLIHVLVMCFKNASKREWTGYYGQTELVFDFLSYTVVSFFLAIIAYTTVEKPFAVLEGIVIKRIYSAKKTSNSENLPAISSANTTFRI